MEESVRDAVFGNVGTMISMRVSAEDANYLVKQFEPQFEANDLLNMNNRHFIVNMVIQGEKTQPFSATTLSLPVAPDDNNLNQVIEWTRQNYARRREEVNAEISTRMTPNASMLPKGTPNPNDARVKVANSAGIDPKIMLKTSPSGTTGSQKLVIPGISKDKPQATIKIEPSSKKKKRGKKTK